MCDFDGIFCQSRDIEQIGWSISGLDVNALIVL